MRFITVEAYDINGNPEGKVYLNIDSIDYLELFPNKHNLYSVYIAHFCFAVTKDDCNRILATIKQYNGQV